jgi:hypothetical protein
VSLSWWRQLVRKEFLRGRRNVLRPRKVWPQPFLPRLEALEERLLLSPVSGNGPHTIEVTNTNDHGAGSLRAAILCADCYTSGPSVIQFNISKCGTVQTIYLQCALPAITQPTTIDATTEPGYKDHPLIVLDGSKISKTAPADGLTISASSTTVEGLAIDNFSGNGVVVDDGAANTIIGGTAAGTGNTIVNAALNGISIDDAGPTAVLRNSILASPCHPRPEPTRRLRC